MSLRARLILTALAIIALVNIASVVYLIERERTAAVLQLRNTIEEDTRLLQVVTAGPLYDGNVAQLSATLDSIFASADLLEMELSETRGDITIARKRPNAAQGGERIERSIPVMRGRDELGKIRLVYTTANIEQRLADSRDAVVLLSLLLMAGLALAIYLLAARLTRLIERLTEAAQAIADGDLERDIDARGARELEILGQSFVRMRDAVRQKMADLEATNLRLADEVSKRTRVEEQMRIKDNAIATSVNAVAITGVDGKIYYANPAFVRMWRFADESEIIGKMPADFTMDPAEAHAIVDKMIEQGSFFGDLTCKRADGTAFPAQISASVVLNPQGAVTHLMASFVDVTDRTLAELRLQESEQRLNSFFVESPAGLAIFDRELRWTHVNPMLSRINGLPPEAHIGRRPREILSPELAEGIEASVQRILATGQSELNREVSGATPADPGVRRHWLFSQFPLPDGQGRVAGVGVVVVETTTQKRAEQAIMQINEELETRVQKRTAELASANKDLEAFAYSVSHDLRAPLRGIDGFSHVLVANYGEKLDPEARRLLGRIRAGAQRMGHLITDMLQLSRVARSTAQNVEVDVSALALAVVNELQSEAASRAVEWRIAPGMTVHGDPGLLRIALVNLLGNALKYTRDAAPARIELGMSGRAGRLVEFFVRDNGAGFDMAYADRLFQPFQRLHASHEFEGSGIGLATVQRVIAKHGGEIRANARPGEGATFHFTLPA